MYLEHDWEVEAEELAEVDDLLELSAGQVAEADVANLAATHEVVESLQRLLKLHSRVPPMGLRSRKKCQYAIYDILFRTHRAVGQ